MNEVKTFGLSDHIFPGTELAEALNRKELLRSVLWLVDAGRVKLNKDATEFLKDKGDYVSYRAVLRTTRIINP